MFGSFLRRYKKPKLAEEASSRVLRDLVPFCSCCHLPLHGHEYRLVAATILSLVHMDRFRDLLSAIRGHHWEKVLSFQDWEGDQANAELFAIRCPDGGLSLALISAPFALEEPYTLMHQETFDDDGSRFLNELPVSDTWHSF